MNGPLLKAREIADEYRVSSSTVHRWRRQGLPSIRVGRSVRFRREDVANFLAAHSDNGSNGPAPSA